VPRVEPEGQPAGRPAEARDEGERQRLNQRDKRAGGPVEAACPFSAETDFSDAILKVVGAADNLDFDAHEINRQVAPVNFGEAHGVFLGGDDGVGLAFLAAVDDVENFLLGEAVMIGKAFGINQFRAEFLPGFARNFPVARCR